MIALLLNFLTGVGLSAAAGLNAFLPMLVVGLMGYMGWADLAAPFDLLSHPIALIVVGVLAILDFVGDKVPAVDSFLHTAGMVVAPIAGAILFVASTGLGEIPPLVAAIAGLIVAWGTHAARSAVRPVVTAATAGTGNPIVSLIEDVIAVILTVLALLLPVAALGFAILVAVIIYRFFRGRLKVWQQSKLN